jgi:thiopeptide-type bacteriocin biosynthesis protein
MPTPTLLPVPNYDITKRSFTTGSEWLYYKIYCNPKMAEQIIIENIGPLLKKIKEDQLIEKWFFIRYADPDIHIRLRLKLKDTRYLNLIQIQFNELFDPFIENRLIEKIQLDTYNRELERYGFDNIEDSETLFCMDSEAVLELISELYSDEEGDLIRLKYACLNAYRLMHNFKLDKENINFLISGSQQNYFKEHGSGKELKFALDDKYRKYRKSLDLLLKMGESYAFTEEDQFITAIIAKKEQEQQQIINFVLLKNKMGKIKINIHDYIRSLIHMNVNRLFKSKQRTYELLVFDFLQRSLKSNEARRQKQQQVKMN